MRYKLRETLLGFWTPLSMASANSNHLPASFALALLLIAASSFAEAPPIVDTHAHINNAAGGRRGGPDFRGALDAAIGRLDRAGIRRAIVMPPPLPAGAAGYDIESYRFAKDAYSGHILLGGGGGSLNGMIQTAPESVTDDKKNSLRARANEIAAAGAVVFGEIALHHLSLSMMGPQHPYEWTPPDHPLMLLLADIAAEKNIPIDVHIDLVPEDMSLPNRPIFNRTNPATLKANLAAFERLLAHNRAARIVWAHAGSDRLGTRTPELQRALLARHPNLFMSLRLAAAPPPFIALDAENKLKASWLALLKEFPDRFVVGSDFFHAPAGSPQRGPTEETLANYRAALEQMPAELAEAIAHRNAEKIYPIGK
jgi:predicted TIM-barrel fold metal-dependent hydrolase